MLKKKKQKSDNTIQFFCEKVAAQSQEEEESQCFYRFIGEKALFVSKKYLKTLSGVKWWENPKEGGDAIAILNLSKKQFRTIIVDLLKNFKIEQYENSGGIWKKTKSVCKNHHFSFQRLQLFIVFHQKNRGLLEILEILKKIC